MSRHSDEEVSVPIRTFIDESFLNRSQPEWIVEGLLRRGDLAVAIGTSGSGKTFVFGIDLACSVLTQVPWLGMRTRSAPVVMLAYEGQRGLGKRIEAWLIPREKEAAGSRDVVLSSRRFVAYVDRPPAIGIPRRGGDANDVYRSAGATFEALLAQLRELQPGLVIIDPKIGAARLLSENSTSDTQVFVDDVRLIIEATNAAVVVIHHPDKSDKDLRGSTVLRGAADVIMWLKVAKAATGADRRVEFPKVKDDLTPAPRLIAFERVELPPDADGPRSSLRVVDLGAETTSGQSGGASKRVLKVFTDRGAVDQRALVIASALLDAREQGLGAIGNEALRRCLRSAYGLEEGQPSGSTARHLLQPLREKHIAKQVGKGRSTAWIIDDANASWVKEAPWRDQLPRPQEGWSHETDAETNARDAATDSRRFGNQRESRAKATRDRPPDGLLPSETNEKPTRNQRDHADAPTNRRASSPRRGERARVGLGSGEDVTTEGPQ